MIKYMRLALRKFININESELFKTKNYPHILASFPEEYLTSQDKQIFDLNAYYKDRLLNFEYEADLIIICLAPIVFEIGLDLFNIEGINKEDFSEIKIFTQHFPSFSANAENQIFFENLKILHRQGRYSVIYSNQLINKFEGNKKIDFNKFVSNEKYNEKINIIAEFKCEECEKESEIIQIKKFNDLSFCKNCLKNFLRKQTGKRVKNLIAENFLNTECKFINKFIVLTSFIKRN